MRHELQAIRHDLRLLKAWVELWRDDAKANLPITQSSIGHALSVIDRASGSLDRLEAEQKEAA
ncbi:hypothetical protein NKH61_05380 [Mesorhizobium sp. M1005]|uniref:hypothetical protein n=1 Tax=unclassified Mesorhizobium TaxID=325217 RepID=UPI003339D31D